MKRRAVAPALLAVLALCGAPLAAQTVLDFSADERRQIAAHGPWPPPRALDTSNRVERRPAAVAFGRRLFGDRALSADGRVACADCHDPARAFQDGRALGRLPAAAGADDVHGRLLAAPAHRATAAHATTHSAPAAGPDPPLRNTPSLLDVAQQRWFGWDGAHDSLWAASLAPLTNPGEMGPSKARGLASRVRGRPDWRNAWRQAYATAVPADDETVAVGMAKALAAYQATLVSPRTPFDEFRDALVRGDRRAAARLPLPAQRGLRIFIGSGRCSTCHAGPRFSNGEFGDIGAPFFASGGGVDSGRHGGLARLSGSRLNRLGPFNDAGDADPRATTTRHVVALHRHFGEFRVPGLRQLARTAPYLHDGSLTRLEDVVRHYSELDEDRLHADGERILRRLSLNPEEAADLAAFLRALGH